MTTPTVPDCMDPQCERCMAMRNSAASGAPERTSPYASEYALDALRAMKTNNGGYRLTRLRMAAIAVYNGKVRT